MVKMIEKLQFSVGLYELIMSEISLIGATWLKSLTSAQRSHAFLDNGSVRVYFYNLKIKIQLCILVVYLTNELKKYKCAFIHRQERVYNTR